MRDINELIGKEFEFEGKGYKVFGAKFEEDMILLSTEIKEQNTKKKYALSEMSKAYFKNVHPYLVEVMTTAITDSPYDFRITAGARTAKEQNALYQIGRTRVGNKVTNADGYIKKSNHQIKVDGFGYAIDFVILNGKVLDWDTESKYQAVAKHILEVGHKLGINLEWGGNWKFKDYPHIQIAGADKIKFK